MKPRESLTTLPPSPDAVRHSRVIKYSIAMSIRMVCVICLIFAQGWWLAFFAVGAIVLPYFAVVLANVGGLGESGTVQRPGAVVLARPMPSPAPEPSAPSAPQGGDPTGDRP
ncbi:DUF3099 domain-containing protein [Rathayibacter sp. VKM Ac-2803]|uniref:DUF3099 domain-containing protein n=1 Tax=unclassified Rathayibacter TaxID=2609250 RepID=UPI00135B0CF5|nr:MULTISPECIES: DUF3099 domain-containing protein [unclassified Rathayibacter]MWV49852.1 DUF3099 domain-containing protein [Rathayibacter sp. VKM Ac-2803]MWV57983.1 DUF3099 domain-containing protein [Rathayibacter sp. VKM Ac-2754]